MRRFVRIGARRRVIAFTLVGAAVLAACDGFSTGELLSRAHPELVSSQNAPSLGANKIDRDLSHYVLMALEDGEFKGDNGVTQAIIRGGHVGVNAPGHLADGNERLRMCQADRPTSMDKGSQIVAGSAYIGDKCNVWDVFIERGRSSVNPMVHSYSLLPDGSVTPIFKPNNNDGKQDKDELPPAPTFACESSLPKTVIRPPFGAGMGGGSAANPLHPNLSYNSGDGFGDVILRGNTFDADNDPKWTHVYLADNTIYKFCNLRLDSSVWVHMGAKTTILVDGDFELGNGNTWGDASSRNSRLVVKGTTVEMAKNSVFNGVVWAPNAQLRLGNANTLNGNFWAKTFISDSNLRINPETPSSTTTTTSVTTLPPE